MIDILSLTSDDDNRIILRPIEGHPDCQREFINACYVDVSYIASLSPYTMHMCLSLHQGYRLRNKFIATQGNNS